MIGLSLLVDWKSNSYDVILVIVDCLIKIEHFKPVKTRIDVAGLVEVIIKVVIKYHGLPELIISDQD